MTYRNMFNMCKNTISTSKILFPFVLSIMLVFVFSSVLVYAQENDRVPGNSSGGGEIVPGKNNDQSVGTVTLKNPLKVNSVGEAVNKGIEIFTYIAILGAVIAFIVVGLRFVMAQGKPEKLKEAGTWLWYIVVGVAIILGARLMISVVINTFEATDTVNTDVINSARRAVRGQ